MEYGVSGLRSNFLSNWGGVLSFADSGVSEFGDLLWSTIMELKNDGLFGFSLLGKNNPLERIYYEEYPQDNAGSWLRAYLP